MFTLLDVVNYTSATAQDCQDKVSCKDSRSCLFVCVCLVMSDCTYEDIFLTGLHVLGSRWRCVSGFYALNVVNFIYLPQRRTVRTKYPVRTVGVVCVCVTVFG